MSTVSADLYFGNGIYKFSLGLSRIDEIERRCQAGLADIYGRIKTGVYPDGDGGWIHIPEEAKWKTGELVEVIRQGLIGGNGGRVDGIEVKMSDYRANEMIKNYLEDRPLVQAWVVAHAVLIARIEGYEAPKKDEPGKSPAKPRKRASDTRASSAKKDMQAQ